MLDLPASYVILPEGILPGDFIDSPAWLHILFAVLLGGSTRKVFFGVSNKNQNPLQTLKPDCQLGFYPQGIFQFFQSIWTFVRFGVYIFVVVKKWPKHPQTTTFKHKKGVQINPNMQINHASATQKGAVNPSHSK